MKPTYAQLMLWLTKIDELVNTDRAADDEATAFLGGRKFTHQEGREMAQTISSVYTWSHRIHCEACRSRKATNAE